MLVLDLVVDLLEYELADDAGTVGGQRGAHRAAVYCVVGDLVGLCDCENTC